MLYIWLRKGLKDTFFIFSEILETALNLFGNNIPLSSLQKKSENNYLHINESKRFALIFWNRRDALIMTSEVKKTTLEKFSLQWFRETRLKMFMFHLSLLAIFEKSRLSINWQQGNHQRAGTRDKKRGQTKLTKPKVVHDWFFQIVLFKKMSSKYFWLFGPELLEN